MNVKTKLQWVELIEATSDLSRIVKTRENMWIDQCLFPRTLDNQERQAQQKSKVMRNLNFKIS